MTKQVFEDGSILLTGKELNIAIEAAVNHRGAYDIDCSFCIYEGDENYCEGCSVLNSDRCCSCHLSAPCSYCVESKFEVSPFLINYKHIRDKKNKRWECFKSNKEVFDKFAEIEKAGLLLSAETLTTGEIAMYIEDDVEKDYEIQICNKPEFKDVMCKMIMDFDLSEVRKWTLKHIEN